MSVGQVSRVSCFEGEKNNTLSPGLTFDLEFGVPGVVVPPGIVVSPTPWPALPFV